MARAHEKLALPADMVEALGLLTRLPLPDHRPRGAGAAWAWPVAGLVVALIAGTLAAFLLALGVPPGPTAGLTIAAQVALTGGLHEDGLGDTADGFWGGHTPARRLEIMKDSRVGSYGVLALVLSIGLRWSALSLLFSTGHLFAPLVTAAVFSRGAMSVMMSALPNARGTGLAATVGQPSRDTALLAIAVALVLGVIFAGSAILAPILWLTLAWTGFAALARAKIGGQTGDVLGATQQIGEIVVLTSFAALV